MENDFECIKIKDGLYLANLQAAQDFEFLVINKLAFIVNCSAQTPNHYQTMGVKYLKFKLIKDKPHKLFNQELKKIHKIQKFMQQAEDNSLCCLFVAQANNQRSLVLVAGYLMYKYRWKLGKTLEFIRTKGVYISLTEHFIHQLEFLQQILIQQQGKNQLSQSWKGPYMNEDQETISKTFLNSQEITNFYQNSQSKTKKTKKITWQDKIQKQQKKVQKQQKLKQQRQQKQKCRQAKQQQKKQQRKSLTTSNYQKKTNNFINSSNVSTQLPPRPIYKQTSNSLSKKPIKSVKSSSLNKISCNVIETSQIVNGQSQPKLRHIITQQDQFVLQSQKYIKNNNAVNQKSLNQKSLNQKSQNQKSQNQKSQNQKSVQKVKQIDAQTNLMKLIKKNMKIPGKFMSKGINEKGFGNLKDLLNIQHNQGAQKLSSQKAVQCYQQASQDEQNNIPSSHQPLYNLTINNFINPNIILNKQKTQCKLKKQQQSKVNSLKVDKSHKGTGLSYAPKNGNHTKIYKRKSQYSPKNLSKERLEKGVGRNAKG